METLNDSISTMMDLNAIFKGNEEPKRYVLVDALKFAECMQKVTNNVKVATRNRLTYLLHKMLKVVSLK